MVVVSYFRILDMIVGIDFISKPPKGTMKKSTEKRKTDFKEERLSSNHQGIHRKSIANLSEIQNKSGLDHKKDKNTLEINQEKGMSNFRCAYGIDSISEIHDEDIKIVGDTPQEPISNSKLKQKVLEKEISKTPAGFSDDFAAEYNKYADNVTVSDTFLKPKENVSKQKVEIDGKIKESSTSKNQTNLVRVIELNKWGRLQSNIHILLISIILNKVDD